MPPKVSVVIPVYNAEKYIERCVRSLFEQTLDSIEYIFVDDCSPDNSVTVMEKVLTEYPHRKDQVKIIRHEVNQGPCAARRHALQEATGDYVISCDADDWVDYNLYEKMYHKAIDENADMVYCDFCIDSVWKRKNIGFKTVEEPGEFFFYMCANQRYVSICNKLYRRSVACLNLVNCFDHIRMNEDFIYNIMCFEKVFKISHLKRCYYHYFSNFDSVSKQKWKRCHFENIIEIHRIIADGVNAGKYASRCRMAFEQVILFLLLRHPEVTTQEEFVEYKRKFASSLWLWSPMTFGRKCFLWLGMMHYKLPFFLLKLSHRV